MDNGGIVSINNIETDEKSILAAYHNILLEALRAREKEIFPYLAIIGPSLGGFAWLLYKHSPENIDAKIIYIATVGISLLFLLGAWYSVALGYNYRSILLQIKVLDRKLKIQPYILKSWRESDEEPYKNYETFFKANWCIPPEVIKCFWLSFPLLTLSVTVAMTCPPIIGP